jgi:hypothetical protein
VKRTVIFILFLTFPIFILGCGPIQENEVSDSIQSDAPDYEAGITGYIMDKRDGRILVVSPEKKDFSSTGGMSEFYDAIWFSNPPNIAEIGMEVKVWSELVLQSYPGQAEVTHLEIIPSPKPKGAKLTESEALAKALSTQRINRVLTVKSIEYSSKSNEWFIELKDTNDYEVITLRVKDK